MSLATLSKPQVLTQSRVDSDYIIQNILRMNSYYIIQTSPECGLWHSKQGLDGLWCVN